MGGTPVWVMAGCALTGLGIANVVPLLFRSAARTTFDGRGLAIVTGVGYAGFLVGPPLVGFAANAVGLPRAMWLVVVGGLALARLGRQFSGGIGRSTVEPCCSIWTGHWSLKDEG